MTIVEDRLAALDGLELKQGNHSNFEQGHCAMEVVAWLAGEGHTDAPVCASPYLRRFTIRLNDRWSHEQRQSLIPFLPRMVGTGDDGKDAARRRIARRALCVDLLPPWLRLAGLDDMAEQVEAAVDLPDTELRALLWKAHDAGWAKRRENMDALRARIKTRLAQQPHAVAVADAAAAAVADAAAAAVAAAAAAAVAAADAAAVAAADKSWDAQYNAAYAAARQYYRDNPLSLGEEFVNLAETQRGLALDLLDRLIDADEVSA